MGRYMHSRQWFFCQMPWFIAWHLRHLRNTAVVLALSVSLDARRGERSFLDARRGGAASRTSAGADTRIFGFPVRRGCPLREGLARVHQGKERHHPLGREPPLRVVFCPFLVQLFLGLFWRTRLSLEFENCLRERERVV